jgi:hypothetical protein
VSVVGVVFDGVVVVVVSVGVVEGVVVVVVSVGVVEGVVVVLPESPIPT